MLDAYAKAYNDRTNREAWLHGFYTNEAMKSAIINVMPYAIGCAMSKDVKHVPMNYMSEPIKFEGKESETKVMNENDMHNQEYDFMKLLP